MAPGRPHGEGEMRANGDVLKGTFECGQLAGRATISYGDGGEYEGGGSACPTAPARSATPTARTPATSTRAPVGPGTDGERRRDARRLVGGGAGARRRRDLSLPQAGGSVDGAWEHGAPHGAGRLTPPNGTVVEGTCGPSIVGGDGRLTAPSGDAYFGAPRARCRTAVASRRGAPAIT